MSSVAISKKVEKEKHVSQFLMTQAERRMRPLSVLGLSTTQGPVWVAYVPEERRP